MKRMFDCGKIRKNHRISDDVMQKIKADFIIIGCVCVLALFFFLLSFFDGRKGEGTVVIIQEDEVAEYPLSQNTTFSVFYKDGGYNLIMIQDGYVRVTDADCPDKLCVKQRSISQNGESIICLPHKLVVQITSGKESDLDAVTN